ncbi:PREDICTED: cystatin-like [Gavialis gangeticus]|uniref:cystatin-like n=1 Tax=Gavialis gangeticus TaxID=94835 RepID=UPI00092FAC9C|nr:PREDICTED: cystatin-like [Gavialis gangeticus]
MAMTMTRGEWRWAALALLLLAAVAAAAAGTKEGGRRSRLLGGLQDANENDEGVQRALQFAMSEYNKASNDKYSSRVARVVRAQKQIVAGVKYILEVELGRTTCTKSATDLQSCAFHKEPEMAKRVTCNFEVLSVPWLNQITLLKNNCQ